LTYKSNDSTLEEFEVAREKRNGMKPREGEIFVVGQSKSLLGLFWWIAGAAD
jgi:hypothetical protein